MYETDKIYKTRFATGDDFLLKEIIYNSKQEITGFKGIYVGKEHLGICPLGADRLILPAEKDETNMTPVVRVNKETEKFIKSFTRVDNYYYIPYWFEAVEDGLLRFVSPEKLPEYIKNLILKKRDGK